MEHLQVIGATDRASHPLGEQYERDLSQTVTVGNQLSKIEHTRVTGATARASHPLGEQYDRYLS